MKKRLSIVLVVAIAVGALAIATLFSYQNLVLGSAPDIEVEDSGWRLRVDGYVQHPLNLSLNELVKMPQTTVKATLYCVDAPTIPVAQGNWTGVKLALLLDKAGVSAEAVKIAFYAEDGYATDLKIETARRDDVVVAYEKDGENLPESIPQHPSLRLVVPGAWGYKWISGLNHIELVNYDFKGRWESSGYPDTGENP